METLDAWVMPVFNTGYCTSNEIEHITNNIIILQLITQLNFQIRKKGPAQYKYIMST